MPTISFWIESNVDCHGCQDNSPSGEWVCSAHVNGFHVALVGDSDEDDEDCYKFLEAWPIKFTTDVLEEIEPPVENNWS